jgi:hypothetical protein
LRQIETGFTDNAIERMTITADQSPIVVPPASLPPVGVGNALIGGSRWLGNLIGADDATPLGVWTLRPGWMKIKMKMDI